ncbi:MAG: sugar transferase [Streptococcus sp.]|nr:sugar transferase [Streptococcus sp.]
MFLKRFLDILISLVSLVIFLPIILIIGIMIKCDSSGPIIFKQRRIGRFKNEFYILKFRTMYTDTPSDLATDLLKNSSKSITSIGSVLRKTSLDEIPQLVNILLGDMSLVGPRPSLWNQYDLIKKRDDKNIHKIRPGLTGWAQVNGRDELNDDKKVEYDKYYLDNQSLKLDICILFKTFFNVLKSKGIVEGQKQESYTGDNK